MVGGRQIIVSFAKLNGEYLFASIAARKNIDPDVARRFVAGMQKAFVYMATNPHEATAVAEKESRRSIMRLSGSSSGSAAAVAAGIVPVAFGTQTAGSVIRPAAYCSVVGYKPIFSVLSLSDAKPLSQSLDTAGVICRTVDDAAYIVGPLSNRTFDLDAAHLGRVAICHMPHWHLAEQPSLDVVAGAASLFTAVGLEAGEAERPDGCGDLAAARVRIMTYEAAASYRLEMMTQDSGLSASFRQILASGALVGGAGYARAQQAAETARKLIDAFFAEHDVLIAPSAPGEAPAGLRATGDPVFGRIWTMLGYPCVHVPTGYGPNGLPVGVTLVGARWQDASILASAGHLAGLVADRAAPTGGMPGNAGR